MIPLRAWTLISLGLPLGPLIGNHVSLCPVAAEGEQVILEAADGTTVVRERASFAPTDLMGEPHRRIRFTRVGMMPASRGPLRVGLTGGDRLWGHPDGGDGDRLGLRLETVEGQPAVRLVLPVDRIVSLVFQERGVAGGTDWTAPAQGDRLYHARSGSRRSGGGNSSAMDRVDGFLEEFTIEGILFTSDLGTRAYGWEEVGALFIESLDGVGASAAVGEGALLATVDLVDGGRLGGTLLSVSGVGCGLDVPGCGALGLPAAAIDQILIQDGSLVFLSDIPAADRGPLSPFGDELGMTWPPLVDRAVTGGPLLAGGRRWSRGIGVHAPSEVRWTLDGWSSLRGTVAVDGSARLLGVRGSVVFRVLLDGRELWASPVLTADDAPLVLPALDISAGGELVLHVDPTADGFAGDRGNWLDLLLVR
jgi:hypothetical protein